MGPIMGLHMSAALDLARARGVPVALAADILPILEAIAVLAMKSDPTEDYDDNN